MIQAPHRRTKDPATNVSAKQSTSKTPSPAARMPRLQASAILLLALFATTVPFAEGGIGESNTEDVVVSEDPNMMPEAEGETNASANTLSAANVPGAESITNAESAETADDTPTILAGIRDPMRLRPSLPRFLPAECEENLGRLLPCWLENGGECGECLPLSRINRKKSSLASFLEFFRPPVPAGSESCSDLEAPICPITSCCSSCKEVILEFYECWWLVEIVEGRFGANEALADSYSNSTDAAFWMEDCSFECDDDVDALGSSNATTTRGR